MKLSKMLPVLSLLLCPLLVASCSTDEELIRDIVVDNEAPPNSGRIPGNHVYYRQLGYANGADDKIEVYGYSTGKDIELNSCYVDSTICFLLPRLEYSFERLVTGSNACNDEWGVDLTVVVHYDVRSLLEGKPNNDFLNQIKTNESVTVSELAAKNYQARHSFSNKLTELDIQPRVHRVNIQDIERNFTGNIEKDINAYLKGRLDNGLADELNTAFYDEVNHPHRKTLETLIESIETDIQGIAPGSEWVKIYLNFYQDNRDKFFEDNFKCST